MWAEFVVSTRTELGISQRSLASLASVNRSTLRRIEAGETDVGIGQVENVLAVLGYELDAMKVRDVPKHTSSRRKRKHKLIRLRFPREV